MALPKNFISKYKEIAKDSMLYGFKIEDMTRDELIACCAAGWAQAQKNHAKENNENRGK